VTKNLASLLTPSTPRTSGPALVVSRGDAAPQAGAACLVCFDDLGDAHVPVYDGPNNFGAILRYYLAPSIASDIATYKAALSAPSAGAENTITVAVTGSVETPIATFITPPGEPGAKDFPAGTSMRHIYAAVSNGSARIHLQVHRRSAAGVETLVRDEYSDTFESTTPTDQDWVATVASAGTLLATDRLVVRLFALRMTGPTTINVITYFEGPSHSSQVQTTITSATMGIVSGPPPYVTSLPISPANGAEVYLLADATLGAVWHLRYNAAAAVTTYKTGTGTWEFLGGAPMSAESFASESLSTGTFSDTTTVGPQLTAPVMGDYEIGFGCAITLPPNASFDPQGYCAPKVGTATANAATSATFQVSRSSDAAAATAHVYKVVKRAFTTAALVKLQYATASGITGTFSNRVLNLRPYRVG
jgi:hypothetical protein